METVPVSGDWRKKRTNSTAEKILIICKVLNVSPEWMLSGIEAQGSRGNAQNVFVIYENTEAGELIKRFNSLDLPGQQKLLGYAEALASIEELCR